MVDIHTENNIMVAVLSGELDQHRCALIRKKIDASAESERPRELHLDFSSVQFMDSSGIGLVMGRYRQMSLLGGRLRVINIPPHLERMFSISGLGGLGVL